MRVMQASIVASGEALVCGSEQGGWVVENKGPEKTMSCSVRGIELWEYDDVFEALGRIEEQMDHQGLAGKRKDLGKGCAGGW